MEVLVFENEEGVGIIGIWSGVEECFAGGYSADGEAEWSGVVEAECDI